MRHRTTLLLALALTLATVAAACGRDDGSGVAAENRPVEVRVGMFPNLTHAPGLIAVERGLFPEGTEVTYFNAGPEAIEALFAGALDISYIGPNPAINGFSESNGEALRIIAGSTSGGAALVVRPGVTAPEDLKGEKVASPQLGNTQDVALRAWLADNGLDADLSGGGDVSIVPQANADTLAAFRAGDIAGAWVPEPWATRLVREGGGRVLVDERELWEGGRFVTTHVIVRTEYLDEHPAEVKAFLEGHVAAVELASSSPEEAKALVNAAIEEATGTPIAPDVLDASWENLELTVDPIAASLEASKDAAVEVGLLEDVDLDGIYALELLNELLDDPVRGL